VIIAGFNRALQDALKIIEEISVNVDVEKRAEMIKLIKSTIGTKFVSRWSDLMCNLALDAVKTVAVEVDGKREVDIKRYARIEKVGIVRWQNSNCPVWLHLLSIPLPWRSSRSMMILKTFVLLSDVTVHVESF
jgi:hypothetical protein